MGYKRSILLLDWQDPESEFHGLEVRLRRMSVDLMLDLVENLGALKSAKDDGAMSGVRDVVGTLADAIGSHLIGWNLTEPVYDDDGQPVMLDNGEEAERPVPATTDGLRSQDVDLLMAVTDAWLDVAVRVNPLSRRRSSGGSPSPEANGSTPPQELAELLADLSPSPAPSNSSDSCAPSPDTP